MLGVNLRKVLQAPCVIVAMKVVKDNGEIRSETSTDVACHVSVVSRLLQQMTSIVVSQASDCDAALGHVLHKV